MVCEVIIVILSVSLPIWYISKMIYDDYRLEKEEKEAKPT